MDTRKRNKTLLDVITDIELELFKNSKEYTEQFLSEEGVNVQEEKDFASNYMKRIQFLNKATLNKKSDIVLLEKAIIQLKDAIVENLSKTTETLAGLLQVKNPSVQFRKLDKWTDDEIRDVLADADLVKLIEELEKK